MYACLGQKDDRHRRSITKTKAVGSPSNLTPRTAEMQRSCTGQVVLKQTEVERTTPTQHPYAEQQRRGRTTVQHPQATAVQYIEEPGYERVS